MKARNIFAVLASKRRAGSHRKSNKALRRLAKQTLTHTQQTQN